MIKNSVNPMSRSRSIFNQVFIAVLLLGSYVYFFPRWADPNQNSRLDMIVAVVDDGTLMIDRYVSNTVDYAKVNGHYYSDKPPGSAFLGIPVYAGIKLVLSLPVADQWVSRLANNPAFQATLKADGSGVYADKVRFALAQVALTILIPVMASVLLGLLLYRCLVNFQVPAGLSTGIVLIYGLLTPAFAYAGAYYSHALSAVFLFAAFYWVRAERVQSPLRLVGAGLCLGFAVLTEYSVILIAAILFVFAAYRLFTRGSWARVGLVAVPAGLMGLVLMVYNQTVFGGPFNLGYEYSELWAGQHQTGFMSLTLPHLDAVWGITFSPFRGLFFLSPILLLSIPGFWLWWRSPFRGGRTQRYRAEFWVALLIVAVMFLFNTSSSMWWGGFAIGPRYFLPALPYLALALGFAAQQWARRTWFKITAGILMLWSLIANVGLSIAGQAFPSDTIVNPLFDYALPNWAAGNIARNLGTVLGLKGLTSLMPLLIFIGLALVVWVVFSWQRISRTAEPGYPAGDSGVAHG